MKRKGRPPSGKKVAKYSVTLDPATVEKARKMGNGGLSEGVRKAVLISTHFIEARDNQFLAYPPKP